MNYVSFTPRESNACMLINVDRMKRDDDRVVSAPGCYIARQLIGDRVRRRSTLDDGSKATTREVIIILVSDPWRCASRKLKKGRENGKRRISYPTEYSTVFDRGVAFTFRSHAQAYYPRGDIFALTHFCHRIIYPRLCFPRYLYIFTMDFPFWWKWLIPEMLRYFLSRILMREDSETRISNFYIIHCICAECFYRLFQNNVFDNNYVFHIF